MIISSMLLRFYFNKGAIWFQTRNDEKIQKIKKCIKNK